MTNPLKPLELHQVLTGIYCPQCQRLVGYQHQRRIVVNEGNDSECSGETLQLKTPAEFLEIGKELKRANHKGVPIND